MNDKNKKDFRTYENYQPQIQPVDKPKSDKRAKIDAWLAAHTKIVLAAIAVFALLLAGIIFYLFNSLNYSVDATVSDRKVEPKTYSRLTGLEVTKEDAARPVTAVIIENSPEARPQSGLKKSGVIFESVAEGGITRFLTLYQEAKPGTIGPIRSVRPQFASWAAPFDAGLAHVGGSDIPLQKLRSGQIKDLDQFANPNAYARVSNRAAPHNMYSSDEKLQAANQAKGYNKSEFTAWKRIQKEAPAEVPDARSIAVPVSEGLFAVNYTWDQASNSYPRTQGGQIHTDRELGQLAPKVVITMQVPHDVIRDSNGYSYPDVNTSGKAWLFQNGTVAEVAWSKADDKTQIKFTDAEGKDVQLNAGQTWITAIRPDRTPTWQ